MQTAKIWKYTGNHGNGKSCERHNPHGFELNLVVAMSLWADGEPAPSPLTKKDVSEIKVIHHRGGDDFGHEVTVSAPAEVWEKGQKALAVYSI